VAAALDRAELGLLIPGKFLSHCNTVSCNRAAAL
jgi:hypothetical protein